MTPDQLTTPAAPKPVVDAERSWTVFVIMTLLVFGPMVGAFAAMGIAWSTGGLSWIDLGIFLVFWVGTSFGIEVGYHRYLSHAAFRTGPVFETVMIILAGMSIQGPGAWWAANHRKHHKYADQPGDPHSPHTFGPGVKGMLRGLWDAHVGSNFRAPADVASRTWKQFVPDLMTNPRLKLANRWFLTLAMMISGLAIPALLGGLLTGTLHGAWTGFLWGGLTRLFCVNQSVYAVNSLAHGFGSRPFALHSRDQSTNLTWLAWVTQGGGYHHNHHVFPASGVTSTEWWQLDPAGRILIWLESLGVIWDLKRGTDVSDPGWKRSVTATLRMQGVERAGTLGGLTPKGAFLETRARLKLEVGSEVQLSDFAVSDGLALQWPATPAIVEKVTWRGVGLRFLFPTDALAATIARVRNRASEVELEHSGEQPLKAGG